MTIDLWVAGLSMMVSADSSFPLKPTSCSSSGWLFSDFQLFHTLPPCLGEEMALWADLEIHPCVDQLENTLTTPNDCHPDQKGEGPLPSPVLGIYFSSTVNFYQSHTSFRFPKPTVKLGQNHLKIKVITQGNRFTRADLISLKQVFCSPDAQAL